MAANLTPDGASAQSAPGMNTPPRAMQSASLSTISHPFSVQYALCPLAADSTRQMWTVGTVSNASVGVVWQLVILPSWVNAL